MENRRLIILLILIICFNKIYASDISKANEYFQNKEYEKAIEYYDKDLSNIKAKFNKALALSQLENYEEAISILEGTSQKFKDKKLISNSFYQMGNAYHKMADKIQKEDPQKAAAFFQKSLESYRSSLKFNNENENAEYNLEVTKKKLEVAEDQAQQNQKNEKSEESEESKENKDQQESQEQNNQESQAGEKKENQEMSEEEKKQMNEEKKKENEEIQKANELLDKEKDQQEERRKYQTHKIMDVEKDW